MLDAKLLLQNSTIQVLASTTPLIHQRALDATVDGKLLYVSWQFEGLKVFTW